MPKLILAVLALILPIQAAAAVAAATPVPRGPILWTDQNIPPQVLERLTEAQDLALDLRYDDAEAMIRAVTPQAPEHPLCGVFLVATLLSRIQEGFKSGAKEVPASFFKEADHLVDEIQKQRDAFPDSPYPRVYLGAAYGMRGLAKLYAGDYVASYIDGKKGAGLLKEAVAMDPKLYNAYMGLGQFEYYCGTLSGVLQFLLALPGDPDKGLAMLKTCEDKGTYAAWPCKAYRIRLMTGERHDYAAAEPELAALAARYPNNYDFAVAVFKTLDAGVNTAALRRSADDVLRRMDQGWTPPPYAHMDEDRLRMSLAKACIAAGDAVSASDSLNKLLLRPEPWHSRAAALLKSL
jgi:tetratricopeptide (TPR) repeat protein